MQGIKRLKEAVQKHRENKDINIKYKTPLTSKSLPSRHPLLTADRSTTAVRNVNSHCDKQNIDDACNPLRSHRRVLISNWLLSVQGVSMYP